MLDQFVWGRVNRISPEAPVPVVEFDHESFMSGGAANVARNLTALGARTELFAVAGSDSAGGKLRELLAQEAVDCRGLLTHAERPTSIKTRVIASRQQMVRVDRESRADLDDATTDTLLGQLRRRLAGADAVIVGDYGKGVITQRLLDTLRDECRRRGIWLSLDPKPVHPLNLEHLSLITPNRKEAFELARISDHPHHPEPLADAHLLATVEGVLEKLQPALLLVTLGEHGMLLCQRGQKPLHIPTIAQEVFDVSGAGDTVIAAFTLAIALGASPVEAAVISNHAAGVVVGKVGTAAVTPAELLASFERRP
jgi:D-beta-D-heptose 7-phosphate kinase/D-beta-D-heptose 1-phosphate adenosyltransferase